MKLRVFIIGSGRRVRESFLPALSVLSERFDVIGIHSRTPDRLEAVADQFGMEPVFDLDAYDLSSTDVIALSITRPNILSVLKRLGKQADGQTLVLDTPVLNSVKEFTKLRVFDPYRGVIVTEDHMNFPQFGFLREVIATGLIGDLNHVCMTHSGWNYHGLAVIRSFFGFPYAKRMVCTPISAGGRVIELGFPGNRTATMIDPYDPDHGRLLLAGGEGTITDYDLAAPNAYIMSTVFDGRTFVRYELRDQGGKIVHSHVPRYRDELARADVPDKTQFKIEKLAGLVDVFESIYRPNINRDYGHLEGLYDHLLTRIASRGSQWRDPLAAGGINIMKVPQRLSRK